MEWFKEFIREVIANWPDSKKQLLQEGRMDTLSTTEIGTLGEEKVELLLSKFGFHIELSPGSRTPSDIWAIKKNAAFVQLLLIQVKTTKDPTKYPQKLNKKQIIELRFFSKFVLDAFKTSLVVPDDYKNIEILLSNGYVGVKLRSYKLYKVVSSGAFTFWAPGRKYPDLIPHFKELVKITHNLNSANNLL